MASTWDDLAEVVKRRRLKLGLSQRGAAAAAGVSPTTWQSLEKYHQPVSDLTKSGIERALQWNIGDIDRFLSNGTEPSQLVETNDGARNGTDDDLPELVSKVTPETRQAIRRMIELDLRGGR